MPLIEGHDEDIAHKQNSAKTIGSESTSSEIDENIFSTSSSGNNFVCQVALPVDQHAAGTDVVWKLRPTDFQLLSFDELMTLPMPIFMAAPFSAVRKPPPPPPLQHL
jgi:hypothetical protein